MEADQLDVTLCQRVSYRAAEGMSLYIYAVAPPVHKVLLIRAKWRLSLNVSAVCCANNIWECCARRLNH